MTSDAPQKSDNGLPARILLIESDPEILHATGDILTSAGYELMTAAGGEDDWQLTLRYRPDLILLNVAQTDTDSIAFCRRIKQGPSLAHSFVLLLSSVSTGSEELVRAGPQPCFPSGGSQPARPG